MNTDLLHRATFVLDRVTAERLTAISARLGVSRSALVRDVLQEPIELMHRWVTALPENPTPEGGGAVLPTTVPPKSNPRRSNTGDSPVGIVVEASLGHGTPLVPFLPCGCYEHLLGSRYEH